jgi:hypothetical protein
MSITSAKPSEIETGRIELAKAISVESGAGWEEGYRPGSAGCHELLDRTSLLADMVERQLVEHPACVAKPEWYRLAQQAAESLHELYQQVGAAHLAADEPNGNQH